MNQPNLFKALSAQLVIPTTARQLQDMIDKEWALCRTFSSETGPNIDRVCLASVMYRNPAIRTHLIPSATTRQQFLDILTTAHHRASELLVIPQLGVRLRQEIYDNSITYI